jgi:hypothetical protein
MPASVITTLMAFFKINPFGPQQEDLRMGYMTSILFNSNKKKSSAAKGPKDFFPSLAAPPKSEEEKAEQMQRVCERIGAAYADGVPGDNQGPVVKGW